MGTTPNFGLPWPAPTDPVAAGADNIRALAEAVDTLAAGSYRIHYDTSTISVAPTTWVVVPVTTLESTKGAAVIASANGNGLYCNPGLYQVDMVMTCSTTGIYTAGVGDATTQPPTYRRVSAYGPPSVVLNATWLIPMPTGQSVFIWLSHSAASNASVTARRLTARRVGT